MTDDDILIEFKLEAREILDRLDLTFVQLEQSPDDKKLVGNIFRAMHTLKGSSGFFSFKRLEKVSHASESLLGKIRDGQLTLDQQKTTTLLNALDSLRSIIEGIEENQAEPVGDDSVVVQQLLNLAAGRGLETQTVTPLVQANALPDSADPTRVSNTTPTPTISSAPDLGSISAEKVAEQQIVERELDEQTLLATQVKPPISNVALDNPPPHH